jgi:predicted ABC-type ATPase
VLGVAPIDADAIQRETGLSSATAWTEGLRQCRQAIDEGKTFLVETTLAGRDALRPSTYLTLMIEAKSRGFRVDLTFIALENADAHVARVADRVAAGLHDIPERAIRDRYERSLKRAAVALSIADHAVLIDNSSIVRPFRPIAEIENGRLVSSLGPQGRDAVPDVKWVNAVLRSFYGDDNW